MTNWRKKSLWSVSGRFVSAGLSFVSNIILVRLMLQDDVGLYFLGLSFSWGASLISQWGLSTLVVKWIAQACAKGDQEAVRSAAWSSVFFTVLQSLALASVILVMDLPMDTKVLWGLWTLSIALQNLVPEILRGFDDVKWASLFLGPIPQTLVVASLGTVYIAKQALSFRQVVTIVITTNLISSFLGLVLVARSARPTLRLKNYRKYFYESTPIALSLAATYLLTQADLWVCGYTLPQSEVAIYGVAQRLVVFVSMPMMVLGAVATPTMAQLLASKEHEKLQLILKKAVHVSALIAISIYAIGMLIGWPVIVKLFGPAYGESYVLFLILGLGQILHVFAGPNGYILLMSGEQRSAMRATLVAALILLVGALLGSRVGGAYGIATASASALIIQTIWMWWAVHRKLGFDSHVKLNLRRS